MWTHSRLAEPGAGVRKAAGLAQAAGVGGVGDLEQAGALGARRVERGGEVEQGRGALAVAADALAPDDDDLAGVAQALGQRRGDVFGAAEAPRQLGEEVGGLARGVAGDRLGAAVERGRALGGDEQLGAVAADRLADAQVEDRRAVQRVGAEDEDRVGVVDVARPGPRGWAGRAGPAPRGRDRASGRESTWGEPSASRSSAGPGRPPRWRRRRRSPRLAPPAARSPAAATSIACSQLAAAPPLSRGPVDPRLVGEHLEAERPLSQSQPSSTSALSRPAPVSPSRHGP